MGIIGNLSVDDRNSAIIGSNKAWLQALSNVIAEDKLKARANALTALWNLSANPSNMHRIISSDLGTVAMIY